MQPEASVEPPGPRAPGSPHTATPDSGQVTVEVDELRLSVAAVARWLGIGPATLRTWDRRYGIGPGGHTPGRHRRYSSEDVARLELMQRALARGATPADAARYALAARLPPADAVSPDRPPVTPGAPGQRDPQHPGQPEKSGPTGVDAAEARELLLVGTQGRGEVGGQVRVGGRVLRLPGAGRRARGLGRAALALDAGAARELLTESIAASGVQATWDDVARPVLSAVAQRWADTGAGVEIEHLLSVCVTGVFGALAVPAPPAVDVRPVLLAGMPGELHILPMVVLSAALAQRRVPCRSLGADLPASALVSAIRRTTPVAVVLWSQIPSTADPDMLRSLPRTRPQVRTFVAGPGWAGVDLPPRILSLETLVEATDAISTAASV